MTCWMACRITASSRRTLYAVTSLAAEKDAGSGKDLADEYHCAESRDGVKKEVHKSIMGLLIENIALYSEC